MTTGEEPFSRLLPSQTSHDLWVLCPGKTSVGWLIVSLGMEVVVLFGGRLVGFDIQGIGRGPGVFANACDLPGYLQAGLAAGDLHAVMGNFFGDMEIGGGRAYGGELVTKIVVERFKPGREFY